MPGKLDAIIVGSGPNGFAAAIYLQQKGLQTIMFEQSSTLGGAAKTLELTLPGFKHDICSAIHPLAFDSPFFKTLPLGKFGLNWIHPPIAFAHPFLDGSAHACYRSIEETADQLGKDSKSYFRLFSRLAEDWPDISESILGPLTISGDILKLSRFGLKALMPARSLARMNFKEEKTRVLFYGAAAHSTLPLTNLATASFGLVLNVLGHTVGWPFPQGGAGKIIEALAAYYQSIRGRMVTGHLVKDIGELPDAKAYLFDLTPRQLLEINGTRFSSNYRKRLRTYKYGAGVFKIDYALSEPIPFINEKCRQAGTIHIGYSAQEIEESESIIYQGKVPEKPYVLVSQHTVFDPTRVPRGKHSLWAYCHVPHGSTHDMSGAIEDQIEKAAPGFKDCILHRATHNTAQMELLNPNLVGGEINGGSQDITQMFTRPVARFSPYSTPDPRVYICSSSTPPGGGVHGMCGYHAGRRVWKDHFR